MSRQEARSPGFGPHAGKAYINPDTSPVQLRAHDFQKYREADGDSEAHVQDARYWTHLMRSGDDSPMLAAEIEYLSKEILRELSIPSGSRRRHVLQMYPGSSTHADYWETRARVLDLRTLKGASHLGSPFDPSFPRTADGILSKTFVSPTLWRAKLYNGRARTPVAVVSMCLKFGVDPPGFVKPTSCARVHAWVDPKFKPLKRATEDAVSSMGHLFYQLRPIATRVTADPTRSAMTRSCRSARKQAGLDRVLFHYNGHGVPPPTLAGELWLFDAEYTQYVPASIEDVTQWLGPFLPALYIFDTHQAGRLLDAFELQMDFRRTQWYQQHSQNSQKQQQSFQQHLRADDPHNAFPNPENSKVTSAVPSDTQSLETPPNDSATISSPTAAGTAADKFIVSQERVEDLYGQLVLASCGPDETLPYGPEYPADLFTSCLVTPVAIALLWSAQKLGYNHVDIDALKNYFPGLIATQPNSGLTASSVAAVTAETQSSKGPVGALSRIYTAITDAIAWHMLPAHDFQMIHRQDPMVSTLFRNFLFAQRVMNSFGVSPMSRPSMPNCIEHPLWKVWDDCVEAVLSQFSNWMAYKTLSLPIQQSMCLALVDREVKEQATNKHRSSKSSSLTHPSKSKDSKSGLAISRSDSSNGEKNVFKTGKYGQAVQLKDAMNQHQSAIQGKEEDLGMDENVPSTSTLHWMTFFQPLPNFFADQLDSFETSLELLSPTEAKIPIQLPILLQCLMYSGSARTRSLELMAIFTDRGVWAVISLLSTGVLPYLQYVLEDLSKRLKTVQLDEQTHLPAGNQQIVATRALSGGIESKDSMPNSSAGGRKNNAATGLTGSSAVLIGSVVDDKVQHSGDLRRQANAISLIWVRILTVDPAFIADATIRKHLDFFVTHLTINRPLGPADPLGLGSATATVNPRISAAKLAQDTENAANTLLVDAGKYSSALLATAAEVAAARVNANVTVSLARKLSSMKESISEALSSDQANSESHFLRKSVPVPLAKVFAGEDVRKGPFDSSLVPLHSALMQSVSEVAIDDATLEAAAMAASSRLRAREAVYAAGMLPTPAALPWTLSLEQNAVFNQPKAYNAAGFLPGLGYVLPSAEQLFAQLRHLLSVLDLLPVSNSHNMDGKALPILGIGGKQSTSTFSSTSMSSVVPVRAPSLAKGASKSQLAVSLASGSENSGVDGEQETQSGVARGMGGDSIDSGSSALIKQQSDTSLNQVNLMEALELLMREDLTASGNEGYALCNPSQHALSLLQRLAAYCVSTSLPQPQLEELSKAICASAISASPSKTLENLIREAASAASSATPALRGPGTNVFENPAPFSTSLVDARLSGGLLSSGPGAAPSADNLCTSISEVTLSGLSDSRGDESDAPKVSNPPALIRFGSNGYSSMTEDGNRRTPRLSSSFAPLASPTTPGSGGVFSPPPSGRLRPMAAGARLAPSEFLFAGDLTTPTTGFADTIPPADGIASVTLPRRLSLAGQTSLAWAGSSASSSHSGMSAVAGKALHRRHNSGISLPRSDFRRNQRSIAADLDIHYVTSDMDEGFNEEIRSAERDPTFWHKGIKSEEETSQFYFQSKLLGPLETLEIITDKVAKGLSFDSDSNSKHTQNPLIASKLVESYPQCSLILLNKPILGLNEALRVLRLTFGMPEDKCRRSFEESSQRNQGQKVAQSTIEVGQTLNHTRYWRHHEHISPPCVWVDPPPTSDSISSFYRQMSLPFTFRHSLSASMSQTGTSAGIQSLSTQLAWAGAFADPLNASEPPIVGYGGSSTNDLGVAGTSISSASTLFDRFRLEVELTARGAKAGAGFAGELGTLGSLDGLFPSKAFLGLNHNNSAGAGGSSPNLDANGNSFNTTRGNSGLWNADFEWSYETEGKKRPFSYLVSRPTLSQLELIDHVEAAALSSVPSAFLHSPSRDFSNSTYPHISSASPSSTSQGQITVTAQTIGPSLISFNQNSHNYDILSPLPNPKGSHSDNSSRDGTPNNATNPFSSAFGTARGTSGLSSPGSSHLMSSKLESSFSPYSKQSTQHCASSDQGFAYSALADSLDPTRTDIATITGIVSYLASSAAAEFTPIKVIMAARAVITAGFNDAQRQLLGKTEEYHNFSSIAGSEQFTTPTSASLNRAVRPLPMLISSATAKALKKLRSILLIERPLTFAFANQSTLSPSKPLDIAPPHGPLWDFTLSLVNSAKLMSYSTSTNTVSPLSSAVSEVARNLSSLTSPFASSTFALRGVFQNLSCAESSILSGIDDSYTFALALYSHAIIRNVGQSRSRSIRQALLRPDLIHFRRTRVNSSSEQGYRRNQKSGKGTFMHDKGSKSAESPRRLQNANEISGTSSGYQARNNRYNQTHADSLLRDIESNFIGSNEFTASTFYGDSELVNRLSPSLGLSTKFTSLITQGSYQSPFSEAFNGPSSSADILSMNFGLKHALPYLTSSIAGTASLPDLGVGESLIGAISTNKGFGSSMNISSAQNTMWNSNSDIPFDSSSDMIGSSIDISSSSLSTRSPIGSMATDLQKTLSSGLTSAVDFVLAPTKGLVAALDRRSSREGILFAHQQHQHNVAAFALASQASQKSFDYDHHFNSFEANGENHDPILVDKHNEKFAPKRRSSDCTFLTQDDNISMVYKEIDPQYPELENSSEVPEFLPQFFPSFLYPPLGSNVNDCSHSSRYAKATSPIDMAALGNASGGSSIEESQLQIESPIVQQLATLFILTRICSLGKSAQTAIMSTSLPSSTSLQLKSEYQTQRKAFVDGIGISAKGAQKLIAEAVDSESELDNFIGCNLECTLEQLNGYQMDCDDSVNETSSSLTESNSAGSVYRHAPNALDIHLNTSSLLLTPATLRPLGGALLNKSNAAGGSVSHDVSRVPTPDHESAIHHITMQNERSVRRMDSSKINNGEFPEMTVGMTVSGGSMSSASTEIATPTPLQIPSSMSLSTQVPYHPTLRQYNSGHLLTRLSTQHMSSLDDVSEVADFESANVSRVEDDYYDFDTHARKARFVEDSDYRGQAFDTHIIDNSSVRKPTFVLHIEAVQRKLESILGVCKEEMRSWLDYVSVSPNLDVIAEFAEWMNRISMSCAAAVTCSSLDSIFNSSSEGVEKLGFSDVHNIQPSSESDIVHKQKRNSHILNTIKSQTFAGVIPRLSQLGGTPIPVLSVRQLLVNGTHSILGVIANGLRSTRSQVRLWSCLLVASLVSDNSSNRLIVLRSNLHIILLGMIVPNFRIERFVSGGLTPMRTADESTDSVLRKYYLTSQTTAVTSSLSQARKFMLNASIKSNIQNATGLGPGSPALKSAGVALSYPPPGPVCVTVAVSGNPEHNPRVRAAAVHALGKILGQAETETALPQPLDLVPNPTISMSQKYQQRLAANGRNLDANDEALLAWELEDKSWKPAPTVGSWEAELEDLTVAYYLCAYDALPLVRYELCLAIAQVIRAHLPLFLQSCFGVTHPSIIQQQAQHVANHQKCLTEFNERIQVAHASNLTKIKQKDEEMRKKEQERDSLRRALRQKREWVRGKSLEPQSACLSPHRRPMVPPIQTVMPGDELRHHANTPDLETVIREISNQRKDTSAKATHHSELLVIAAASSLDSNERNNSEAIGDQQIYQENEISRRANESTSQMSLRGFPLVETPFLPTDPLMPMCSIGGVTSAFPISLSDHSQSANNLLGQLRFPASQIFPPPSAPRSRRELAMAIWRTLLSLASDPMSDVAITATSIRDAFLAYSNAHANNPVSAGFGAPSVSGVPNSPIASFIQKSKVFKVSSMGSIQQLSKSQNHVDVGKLAAEAEALSSVASPEHLTGIELKMIHQMSTIFEDSSMLFFRPLLTPPEQNDENVPIDVDGSFSLSGCSAAAAFARNDLAPLALVSASKITGAKELTTSLRKIVGKLSKSSRIPRGTHISELMNVPKTLLKSSPYFSEWIQDDRRIAALTTFNLFLAKQEYLKQTESLRQSAILGKLHSAASNDMTRRIMYESSLPLHDGKCKKNSGDSIISNTLLQAGSRVRIGLTVAATRLLADSVVWPTYGTGYGLEKCFICALRADAAAYQRLRMEKRCTSGNSLSYAPTRHQIFVSTNDVSVGLPSGTQTEGAKSASASPVSGITKSTKKKKSTKTATKDVLVVPLKLPSEKAAHQNKPDLNASATQQKSHVAVGNAPSGTKQQGSTNLLPPLQPPSTSVVSSHPTIRLPYLVVPTTAHSTPEMTSQISLDDMNENQFDDYKSAEFERIDDSRKIGNRSFTTTAWSLLSASLIRHAQKVGNVKTGYPHESEVNSVQSWAICHRATAESRARQERQRVLSGVLDLRDYSLVTARGNSSGILMNTKIIKPKPLMKEERLSMENYVSHLRVGLDGDQVPDSNLGHYASSSKPGTTNSSMFEDRLDLGIDQAIYMLPIDMADNDEQISKEPDLLKKRNRDVRPKPFVEPELYSVFDNHGQIAQLHGRVSHELSRQNTRNLMLGRGTGYHTPASVAISHASTWWAPEALASFLNPHSIALSPNVNSDHPVQMFSLLLNQLHRHASANKGSNTSNTITSSQGSVGATLGLTAFEARPAIHRRLFANQSNTFLESQPSMLQIVFETLQQRISMPLFPSSNRSNEVRRLSVTDGQQNISSNSTSTHVKSTQRDRNLSPSMFMFSNQQPQSHSKISKISSQGVIKNTFESDVKPVPRLRGTALELAIATAIHLAALAAANPVTTASFLSYQAKLLESSGVFDTSPAEVIKASKAILSGMPLTPGLVQGSPLSANKLHDCDSCLGSECQSCTASISEYVSNDLARAKLILAKQQVVLPFLLGRFMPDDGIAPKSLPRPYPAAVLASIGPSQIARPLGVGYRDRLVGSNPSSLRSKLQRQFKLDVARQLEAKGIELFESLLHTTFTPSLGTHGEFVKEGSRPGVRSDMGLAGTLMISSSSSSTRANQAGFLSSVISGISSLFGKSNSSSSTSRSGEALNTDGGLSGKGITPVLALDGFSEEFQGEHDPVIEQGYKVNARQGTSALHGTSIRPGVTSTEVIDSDDENSEADDFVEDLPSQKPIHLHITDGSASASSSAHHSEGIVKAETTRKNRAPVPPAACGPSAAAASQQVGTDTPTFAEVGMIQLSSRLCPQQPLRATNLILHRYSPIVAVGTNSCLVFLYDYRKGGDASIVEFRNSPQRVTTLSKMQFINESSNTPIIMCLTNEDRTVRLWRVQGSGVKLVNAFIAHPSCLSNAMPILRTTSSQPPNPIFPLISNSMQTGQNVGGTLVGQNAQAVKGISSSTSASSISTGPTSMSASLQNVPSSEFTPQSLHPAARLNTLGIGKPGSVIYHPATSYLGYSFNPSTPMASTGRVSIQQETVESQIRIIPPGKGERMGLTMDLNSRNGSLPVRIGQHEQRISISSQTNGIFNPLRSVEDVEEDASRHSDSMLLQEEMDDRSPYSLRNRAAVKDMPTSRTTALSLLHASSASVPQATGSPGTMQPSDSNQVNRSEKEPASPRLKPLSATAQQNTSHNVSYGMASLGFGSSNQGPQQQQIMQRPKARIPPMCGVWHQPTGRLCTSIEFTKVWDLETFTCVSDLPLLSPSWLNSIQSNSLTTPHMPHIPPIASSIEVDSTGNIIYTGLSNGYLSVSDARVPPLHASICAISTHYSPLVHVSLTRGGFTTERLVTTSLDGMVNVIDTKYLLAYPALLPFALHHGGPRYIPSTSPLYYSRYAPPEAASQAAAAFLKSKHPSTSENNGSMLPLGDIFESVEVGPLAAALTVLDAEDEARAETSLLASAAAHAARVSNEEKSTVDERSRLFDCPLRNHNPRLIQSTVMDTALSAAELVVPRLFVAANAAIMSVDKMVKTELSSCDSNVKDNSDSGNYDSSENVDTYDQSLKHNITQVDQSSVVCNETAGALDSQASYDDEYFDAGALKQSPISSLSGDDKKELCKDFMAGDTCVPTPCGIASAIVSGFSPIGTPESNATTTPTLSRAPSALQLLRTESASFSSNQTPRAIESDTVRETPTPTPSASVKRMRVPMKLRSGETQSSNEKMYNRQQNSSPVRSLDRAPEDGGRSSNNTPLVQSQSPSSTPSTPTPLHKGQQRSPQQNVQGMGSPSNATMGEGNSNHRVKVTLADGKKDEAELNQIKEAAIFTFVSHKAHSAQPAVRSSYITPVNSTASAGVTGWESEHFANQFISPTSQNPNQLQPAATPDHWSSGGPRGVLASGAGGQAPTSTPSIQHAGLSAPFSSASLAASTGVPVSMPYVTPGSEIVCGPSLSSYGNSLVSCAATHPLSSWLITGSLTSCINVFDLKGELTQQTKYHPSFVSQRIGPVHALAFHPLKPMFVMGSDKTITFYATNKFKWRE